MSEQMRRPSSENDPKELGFSLSGFYVDKVSAQRFRSAGGNIKFENSIKVVSVQGRKFVLKASTSVSVEGDSPFILDVDVSGSYQAEEEIDEEKVRQNMGRLSPPLLHYASYVTSYLTREMMGVPLILPPALQGKES